MDINTLIKEHLKCVICQQYFSNLMQCYNGHSHCHDCLKKYELMNTRKKDIECTICRTKKGWTTNRQIYQLALDTNMCIECGIEDCVETIQIDMLSRHRNTCPCTRFLCPFQACDSKYFLKDELLSHIKSHKKTYIMGKNDYLDFCMSEISTFGPKIFVFEDHIIHISCQIAYDRRFDTRVLMKAYVIGFKEITDVSLVVYQWNMLNKDYSKHIINLKSTNEIDMNTIPDTINLPGMRNYVYEPPDCVYSYEKLMNGTISKPNLPLKLHDFDMSEEYQEIHTLSISFIK